MAAVYFDAATACDRPKVPESQYRLVLTSEEAEDCYQVHEVFFDGSGAICGWDPEPIAPFGNTPEHLREHIAKISEALDQAILVNRDGQLVRCS